MGGLVRQPLSHAPSWPVPRASSAATSLVSPRQTTRVPPPHLPLTTAAHSSLTYSPFHTAPRSGLAWKSFIDVGAGVIDSDYRGKYSSPDARLFCSACRTLPKRRPAAAPLPSPGLLPHSSSAFALFITGRRRSSHGTARPAQHRRPSVQSRRHGLHRQAGRPRGAVHPGAHLHARGTRSVVAVGDCRHICCCFAYRRCTDY